MLVVRAMHIVLALCALQAAPMRAQSPSPPETSAAEPLLERAVEAPAVEDLAADPTAEAPAQALPAEAPLAEATDDASDPSAAAPESRAIAEESPAAQDELRPAPGADVNVDALISAALARAPDGSEDKLALAGYLDGVASTFQREHGIAAMTASVVKDNALAMARGYGFADVAEQRPVLADSTLFHIGSVSKTFTWTAVMMLVERGQLNLDTDINTYLKSVRIAEAFGAPVTMRHLMHHRAGFEDSMRVFAVGDDDTRTLNEVLVEQQPARVYAPGLRTSYSNWGSALAAQIVADVSGVPYEDFLRREILEPLGMRATVWQAPSKMDADTRAKLAIGYKADNGALGTQGYMQLGAYWPAGGIASTATDMARWMRFHLNGGELDGARLMSAQTHQAMWTRGFDDRPDAPDLAHGFQDRSYRGLRLLGHGGATASFFTNMVLVPELSLGIFVSQSSQQTRVSVSQLPELIIDRVSGKGFAPTLAVATSEPGGLADFAGTYVQNRRVFSSFAATFALTATANVAPMSADALLLTANGQATQYRRVASGRDTFEAADGARIAFLREGNAVVALADGSGVHTFEKVGVLGHPSAVFAALAAALLLALTTLLGYWWRLGRGADYGHGVAAGIAAFSNIVSALCVIGFVVTVALLLEDLESLDIAVMPGSYPASSMLHTHYAGWAMAGAAGLLILALLPAWRASGWGLVRRLHFTAFALTMTLLAILLWHWRVFAAPVY